MSVGRSGRIVIEIEPNVKRELYAALAKNGLTLKEWFLKSADLYLSSASQLPLPLAAHEDQPVHQLASDQNNNQR